MVILEPVNTPEAWTIRAEECPEPWEACGWTEEGQQERFRIVLDALAPKEGERLLDYGCGTGALTDILPAGVDYVGYDWSAGMIQRAADEHPGRVFTTFPPTSRFDLVAIVGTFNLHDHWSKERTFHTLRHLWDATGCRALAASMYAGEDIACLQYTAPELERACCHLTWDSRVVAWRENDLLLVARR